MEGTHVRQPAAETKKEAGDPGHDRAGTQAAQKARDIYGCGVRSGAFVCGIFKYRRKLDTVFDSGKTGPCNDFKAGVGVC